MLKYARRWRETTGWGGVGWRADGDGEVGLRCARLQQQILVLVVSELLS